MKTVVVFLIAIATALSCKPTNKSVTDTQNETIKLSDTVRIANEKEEYEIIIIDPGFNSFIFGQARPRGYFTQSYLEHRNRVLVIEWNSRFRQPSLYDSNLYEMPIDYDSRIDYGYEVNYLLYNYFVYFQLKYKQQLTGFVPRI